MLCTAFEGFIEFRARSDFYLHRAIEPSNALQRGAHTASRSDVIVLDQDGIEESFAMIGGPTRRCGHLLQVTQSRRRLSRIENFDAGSLDRVYMFAGDCCDPAEALQEVECNTFAFKQRPGAPRNYRNVFSLRKFGPTGREQ